MHQRNRPVVPGRRRSALVRTIALALALGSASTTVAAVTADGAGAVTAADRRARVLVMTAGDNTLQVPATVPAGPTDVRLVNTGAETHQAALVRLRPGRTRDELFGALAAGGFPGAAKVGRFVGGPNGAPPGGASEVSADLDAGHYVAVCLMPGPDGVLHVMKGMFTEFDVTGRSRPHRRAHHTRVTLDEFRFDVPRRFVRAVRTGAPIEVVNEGTQHHELVVSRLAPGATLSDVARWNEPPAGAAPTAAPTVDVAGVTMLPPGGRVRLQLRLPKGRYTLLCFLPDDHGKHSHLHNGMVFPFDVA
jgi:hypothetical protein